MAETMIDAHRRGEASDISDRFAITRPDQYRER
jgi:hypothetical protein